MCIKIPFREAMCPRDVVNETCICMKHAYVWNIDSKSLSKILKTRYVYYMF